MKAPFTYFDKFSLPVKAAIEVALLAGKLLKKGFGTNYQIFPKTMKNDVVTEYDHAAEELIIGFLTERFPDFAFLCEESGHSGPSKADYCWIIDPLDGTVNFAHSVPFFCISIALVKGEEILGGIIYNPMSNELFVAEKNIGVFLNGEPIKASETRLLEEAYVTTSLSFNLSNEAVFSIKKFSHIASQGCSLRAVGSTALNLAYVAAGRFDAYWSAGGAASSWDVAAGKLMVEMAGGMMTQCNGRSYPIYESSTILACNQWLHDEMKMHLTR